MSTSEATPTEQQQRGRNASPKHLASSANNSRTSSAAPAPPVGSGQENGEEGGPSTSTVTEGPVKVKLVERVTTEWTRPAATRPQERPAGTSSNRLSNTQSADESAAPEPLAIAATEYPWLYMSSTLDACFQNDNPESSSAASTKTAGEASSATSEAETSPSQLSQPDKLKFLDEGSDEFAKAAPAVMQAFHAHGEACSLVESEALKLALQGLDPSEKGVDNEDEYDDDDAKLQVYHDMLEKLDRLHTEALGLETSLVELTESASASASNTTTVAPETNPPEPSSEDDTNFDNDTPRDPIPNKSTTSQEAGSSARSQILGLISASLPVVRARIMNISMAQELVDSALENVSIGLRMESLGIE